MENDYDVLIVGGGLTGGCLVLALADSGLRIGLLEAISDEQRHNSPAGDRALALANATVRILDDLSVWYTVASQAAPIRSIHVSDRGHFGKVRLSADKENVDALGYVITARILEDAVAGAVAAIKGVERICPARVVGLKSGHETVFVSLMREGESLNVGARLVVGADGGDSSVRRLLDIGQKSRDYGQTAIVTLVKPEKNPAGTAFERFTSAGPLAFLPTHDGCCSVVWTLDHENAENAKALPDAEFLEQLQKGFGYRGGRRVLVA
ncbi:MAG: FAD-dependent monooxygenase, partial [Pseudomonadota bacterium]